MSLETWVRDRRSKKEEDWEERHDTDCKGPVDREVQVRNVPHMGIELKAENEKLFRG